MAIDMDTVKKFVIGLALVSLIAGSGAIAMDNFKSDIQKESTTAANNETVTLTSNAGGVSQGGDLFIVATACRNATDPETVLLLGTNCNVSTVGDVVVASANAITSVRIDYTHYTPTVQRNISVVGLGALSNTTSFFDTAGTIMGVALLLMIVIGAFYFVAKR